MLQNGQSELDQLSIRLLGLKNQTNQALEITTFDRYAFNQSFTTPCANWSFTLSMEDTSQANQYFIPGAKIEIVSNDRLQCTGFIDKIERKQSRGGGIEYVVSGRDILGPVVSASLDPQFKITANMTVIDFLSQILNEFGIKEVYTSDENNLNVVTGILGAGGGTKTITTKVPAPTSIKDSLDGKSATLVYTDVIFKETVTTSRPDLKKIPLDQLKPHVGEGAYEVLNRVLSRLGLRCWAHADGSGVVVDRPIFNGPIEYNLIRKIDQQNSFKNNILEGAAIINGEIQPACMICFGQGGGGSGANSSLKCIAINELVGVDSIGNPIKFINNYIARYPGIKILPIRKQLIPKTETITKSYLQKPVFIKDDESRTIEQLEFFTRKQLSLRQKEYLTYEVMVEGHSQNGHPWSVNSLVNVDDDIAGIHQPMWIIEKNLIKSRGDGTTAKLKLIIPYTYEIGN